jgi:hypothetical protein
MTSSTGSREGAGPGAARRSGPAPRLDPGSTLVLLHIPKTAGTALRRALDPLFAPDELAHIYLPPGGIPMTAFTALPEEQRAGLRFVAGHFPWGIHELLPRPVQYVTVLRDPVERVRSLYDHLRARPLPGGRRAIDPGTSMDAFLDQAGDRIDDAMVRMVSGRGPEEGLDGAARLELAKAHLDEMLFVLLQEHLDRDAHELGRLLGVDLRLQPVNAAPQRTRSIPPDVRRAITERNQLDIELVAWARDRAVQRRGDRSRGLLRWILHRPVDR